MTTLYIAAPLACAAAAATLAETLRNDGHHIVSTWHDEVGEGAVDPYDAVVRQAVLTKNLEDLHRADVVVAQLQYVSEDRIPRATYCEVGWALCAGKRVIWCRGPHSKIATNIFDAHPLVTLCTSAHDLLGTVRRVAEAA